MVVSNLTSSSEISKIKLTEYEKEILEGKEGRLKQVALENVIRYANILGAEELCEVTKATVYCGAHSYLNVIDMDDPYEVFSKMYLGESDEIIRFDNTDDNCFVQSCVTACEKDHYKPFNVSKQMFEQNNEYMDMAQDAGVIIANSCAPYLNGWIPVMGEHFTTTESGVTTIGNSLWGARANADGIEAAFWSAICGRTPKWGMHVTENRAGTHLYRIKADVTNKIDWDLLGAAIGSKLSYGAVPVVIGEFNNVNFDNLRQFMTSISITSNCELCHVVGHTPEAITLEQALQGKEPKREFIIENDDLKNMYESVCDEEHDIVDFVSLGCPHYDINNIKMVAKYLKGKKIHPNVDFMIWTVYQIKHMAEVNGYAKIIEDAGGKIYTSTCPPTMGEGFLGKYKGLVFDSYKMCRTCKSKADANIYLGDVYSCIDAAISGKWEGRNRWEK